MFKSFSIIGKMTEKINTGFPDNRGSTVLFINEFLNEAHSLYHCMNHCNTEWSARPALYSAETCMENLLKIEVSRSFIDIIFLPEYNIYIVSRKVTNVSVSRLCVIMKIISQDYL